MTADLDKQILDSASFPETGRVVGQIAHELNNLITPFMTYPQLIRMNLPSDSEEQPLLESLEKTARDMAHLADQLVYLSSNRRTENVNTDIAAVIDELISQWQSEPLPPGVSIQCHAAPDLPPVRCNRETITKALREVISNALDSLDGNGTISITADTVQVPSPDAPPPPTSATGQFLRITVQDTGCGIPESVKNRLFAMFITTKKDSTVRGAGLGLAIVYRTARDAGGWVTLDSSAGQGTTVRIHLPAYTAQSDQPADQSDSALNTAPDTSMAPRDKNRIMFVDDEKVILKLFTMIVKTSIPTIEIDTAENGAEALNLFLQHHHGVIIMDLHMPVMDGQAAFIEIEKKCREMGWDMPSIIFCSGFSPSPLIHRTVTANPKHMLLAKPVLGDTLVEAIQKRLS
jgi:nitrogen-specific signal transduction histidine kinase